MEAMMAESFFTSQNSNTKQNLAGKTAIVTGGAHGLGEAVALRLAQEGCNIMIAGLPGDPVPEMIQRIEDFDVKAHGFIGDISVETQAEECVNEAIAAFGQVDLLINLWVTPMEVITTAHLRLTDFDHILYSNVRSVFLMTKFSLPHLQKSQGCIVSAGSQQGLSELSANPAYAAGLAWVHGFMRGVALENASYGVRAQSVCISDEASFVTGALAAIDSAVDSALNSALNSDSNFSEAQYSPERTGAVSSKRTTMDLT
jgi:NAD(P)-dependent dehydrogenase (short-subunit alcohol dehydrogenase family)